MSNKMSPIPAERSHYFPDSSCPVAVRIVAAATNSQHAYDLTDTPHMHDFTELVAITGGAAIQVIDGNEYKVSVGDVFLLRPGESHHFPERNQISLINFQYCSELLPLPEHMLRQLPGYLAIFQLEPELRSSCQGGRMRLAARDLAKLENYARLLETETRLRKPGWNVAAFALLLDVIVMVSRCCYNTSDDSALAQARLGKVMSFLERDYQHPWQLEEMAKLAGCSVNTLLRNFKVAAGMSPGNYLQQLRLRRAAEKLLRTNDPISVIAASCGFADSNYFSRCFRSWYGISPRDYRRGR